MVDLPKENDGAAPSGHCPVELLICGFGVRLPAGSPAFPKKSRNLGDSAEGPLWRRVQRLCNGATRRGNPHPSESRCLAASGHRPGAAALYGAGKLSSPASHAASRKTVKATRNAASKS